ncbi:MAG TPA: lipocalin family protein [Chitinophagaceae bacterium]|nr:lipocalin family protein [Chitinophagaceae bacterium]
MKKYLLFLPAILFALSFTFTACDKNDTPSNQKSKEELIAQGSWKFKSASNNGVPYTAFATCQADNILDFNINGTGVKDEGSTKCNAGDPQSVPYTWTLANNKTEIQLSSSLFTDTGTTLTIVSVTETQLIVSVGVATTGPIVLVQITFEHA